MADFSKSRKSANIDDRRPKMKVPPKRITNLDVAIEIEKAIGRQVQMHNSPFTDAESKRYSRRFTDEFTSPNHRVSTRRFKGIK